MRQIVLDTETTGLEPGLGHRIIEIGCVELNNRKLTGNDLHLYIQPDREIDAGAEQVHGISRSFLADKPRFMDIAEQLRDYLGDAALIIHNAPFDLGFLDAEFTGHDAAHGGLVDRHTVIDTLVDARQRFPGQRNSLDALCKRFMVDNTGRDLHGALLDAQLLAEVYRAMTGGQTDFGLENDENDADTVRLASDGVAAHLARAAGRPRVYRANTAESDQHDRYLAMLAEAAGATPLWQTLNDSTDRADEPAQE